MDAYSLGLDFGTNSVRALVVRARDGREIATAVERYPSGRDGILLDPRDHNLARQSPADYTACLDRAVRAALRRARREAGVTGRDVVGLGVAATGSTPLPVDASARPLALRGRWKKKAQAWAWLWKDHTALAEAERITGAARRRRPRFLAKCGGAYSSEWYWAKLWRCLKEAPELAGSMAAWVELSDYIPAVLCGVSRAEAIPRNACAASHKAFYHRRWGGWPDAAFLAGLDRRLARIGAGLPASALAIDRPAGRLAPGWAAAWGMRPGIPVAMGALDAHLGAVGAGIRPGTLVKIMGTSSCDMAVAERGHPVPDIPGVCGVAEDTILPGHAGVEAGQAAMGDIFGWFSGTLCGGGEALQRELSAEAARRLPGASGLVALDWHNGNRNLLMNPRLTGLIAGLTLGTTRADVYRALLESAAFGALMIVNRLEEYGVPIRRIVCCGGIAEKNPLCLQIYADVLNRPLYVSRSAQACALGAAIAGAVVGGAWPGFGPALAAMTGVRPDMYRPNRAHAAIYRKLFARYRALHDAFGGVRGAGAAGADLARIMPDLLVLKASGSRGRS